MRESKMNVRFGPTAIPSYDTSDLPQQRTTTAVGWMYIICTFVNPTCAGSADLVG